MSSEDDFISSLRSICTWKRGYERAPHKPLMLLLALGKLSSGNKKLTYSDCHKELTELLREFGPIRSKYHPEYPFVRLQSDGLWEVEPAQYFVQRQSDTDPTSRELLDISAVGHFTPEILRIFTLRPSAIERAAETLLATHFPESLHSDIRSAVGLLDKNTTSSSRYRSPQFREDILIAYNYACAVCGFSLRLNDKTVGIDAAHIRWVQAGGPDSTNNGLALCVLHHKLFDLGAFTLSDDSKILVSERVSGGQHLQKSLLYFHGSHIFKTARPEHSPHVDFISWHRDQVFKERHLPHI